jgi:hypothetical protein
MRKNVDYAGKVIICKSKLVWSNPDYVRRDNNFFFVEDLRGNKIQSVHTSCEGELKKLAQDLQKGLYVSEPVTEDSLVFTPPLLSETTYLDGYFGRPLVPHQVFRYYPLKRKEIKELKQLLFGGQNENPSHN